MVTIRTYRTICLLGMMQMAILASGEPFINDWGEDGGVVMLGDVTGTPAAEDKPTGGHITAQLSTNASNATNHSIQAGLNKLAAKVLKPKTVCKDTVEYEEECPLKTELCHSENFGSTVRSQCPKSCGVCNPDSTELEVKTICTPRPLVATLPNNRIKASSSIDAESGPEKARLDAKSNPWVAASQHSGQWLEVALPEEMTVTGVATQGKYNGDDWVSHYKLMYKTSHWDWYGGGRWLKGNWDHNGIEKHDLKPFKAKYIRFYPKKWNGKIAMRVEVFGCQDKKEVVPTADVVKKLAAGVKDVVDKHVENATASAVQAVQTSVLLDNAKLKGLVASVVQNATTAATSAIKEAAVQAVSDAVQKATEMATARIKHIAMQAIPTARAAVSKAVNVSVHGDTSAAGAVEAVTAAVAGPATP